MKYLLIIILNLFLLIYFIFERFCKIIFIILAYFWEFKPLKDYGFWYKVDIFLSYGVEYDLNDYFINPFKK